MKNKKILFFLLILGISIGFAYLSTNLNITGSSLIKGNSWDVHFENVQVTSGSVTATTPTITNNAHQVNYTVTLNMPGDYFEFTVDAVNDGTIDAMVDTVSNTGLTEDQLKYLDYSVELNNGDPLEHGYILLNQTRKTYKVRLEYKLDITEEDLPDSDQTISLTFTVKYLQTDDNAYTTSTFKTGQEVHELMQALSNDNSNINITGFKKASSLKEGLTNDNIASITESDNPIYLWFEEDTNANDGTGNIYYFCDSNVVYLNKDSSFMFDYYMSLSDISALDRISTLKVKNMYGMFGGCHNLSDISSLSNWDVSNVTNMDELFYSCFDLSNINSLSNWNVSNVASMREMFEYCEKITDINPLSNWNVSSLKNIKGMFYNCENLSNISALSNWDVSNVTTMNEVFASCHNLSDISSLSNWDVSNVTNMSYMFYYCSSLSNASAINSWGTRLNANVSYINMFSSDTTTRPSWYV